MRAIGTMRGHRAFRFNGRATRRHSESFAYSRIFCASLIILLCSFWLAGCIPIPIHESRPLPEWAIMMIPDDLRFNPSEVLVLSQFTIDNRTDYLGNPGYAESIVVKLHFLKGIELGTLPHLLDVQSSRETLLITGAAPGVIPLIHWRTFERLANLCVVDVDGRWAALDFSAWRRIRVGDIAEVYPTVGQLSVDQRNSLLMTLARPDVLTIEQSYTPCAIHGEAKWDSDARAKIIEFFSLDMR